MYIANSISYVARDRQRLDIPYVESRAPDGKVTVYRTTDNPPTDDEVRRMKKHTVDCIDCHNRPTHVFRNPAQSVNGALAQNWMNPALPQVKRLCVEMLEKPYKTEAEALRQIAGGIEGFYQAQYPQVYAAQRKDVDDAVKQTQRIYSLNYFPEMRVSWKAFPDHIGHMYAPGCFRCHDGKHVSSTGKTLTNDCNTCHTILSQKSGNDKATVSLTGQPFRHPGNVGDAWKMMPCSDNACHGAQRP
jgi:hypothetical protein